MDAFLQDLRFSLRSLAKSRGLAAVVVVTLALGIGANTAVFSLTDQILLRLLPVKNPGELVLLRTPGDKGGHTWSDIDDGAQSYSYPFYKDLRDRDSVFSGLLACFTTSLSVGADGRTERADGELVSGNYFDVLGVRPQIGRLLRPEDEATPGGEPVAVLSHGYWTRRFGASPAVLDRPLVVNGHTLTVVGVAQARFQGVQVGEPPDLFVPISMKAVMTPNWDGRDDRHDHWLQIIGRLKPGVSREQAEAGLQPAIRPLLEQEIAESKRMSAQARERYLNKKTFLVPGSRGRQVLQEEARQGLWILTGLVALLLLIACANVASLLIARGTARRREIAVRLAIGAQRGHLLRQLLIESVLLALAGGIAGLLVAAWGIDILLSLLPNEGASGLTADIDVRLLAFNFGAALLTALVFGLLPALRATRPNLVTSLADRGTGAGGGIAHVRLRKGLVVAQIAVTAVLLTTAGLFTRSLAELRRIDPGLRADGLLTLTIQPELNGYTPAQTSALVDRIREDAASLPGVASVSAAQLAVLTDSNAGSNVTIEGYEAQAEEEIHVSKNWVAPQYFETLGIPLRSGREFVDGDGSAAPKVAIVNEAFAQKYLTGRSPVGLRFAFGSGNGVHPDITIVGVAADSRHATLKETPEPFVYIPLAQDPRLGRATLYVRTLVPPATLAPALREAIGRRDAGLPVFDVKTLVEQVDDLLYGERMLMTLSLCFGLVASLLASVGLYGVMAYTVARRTPEIGLRMALGASLGNVRGLVLREAMTLSVIGLAIGIPVSLGTGRLARSLLFGVEPGDPLLLLGAGVLLAAVMLVAAYVPARRASRVNPLVALRHE